MFLLLSGMASKPLDVALFLISYHDQRRLSSPK